MNHPCAAPGGKWSITNLEAMASVKEADFEAAASSGKCPWFLTAWFEATAAGRAADAAAALGKAKPAPGPDGPIHPSHAAPCLRVFTSLVRAGVCQAEAEASIAALGGRGGRGGSAGAGREQPPLPPLPGGAAGASVMVATPGCCAGSPTASGRPPV